MTLQLTPVAPDCADCLSAALARAGFDWQSPFTLVGQLRALDPETRHALFDALIDHTSGDAFLILTAPHMRVEKTEPDAEHFPSEDEQELMLEAAGSEGH